MSAYGYDAAYPPDPTVVKAAGGQIMAVYLTGRYAVPNDWVARIHKAGIGALANYEEAAAELVTAGHTGGRVVGSKAMAAAIAKGFPANNTVGIHYSVDTNVAPSQFEAVGVAFDGINDMTRGTFITHCYGEGALINYLVATGRARRAQWLSASESFPGYDPKSPNVGLVQLVGSNIPNTDQNLITNAAGLDVFWPPGTEVSSGTGVQITTTDWLDMATQAEVAAAVRAELASALPTLAKQIVQTIRTGQPNGALPPGSVGVDNDGGLDGVLLKLRSDVDQIQWGVLDPTTGARLKANKAVDAVNALAAQVSALGGAQTSGAVDLQPVLDLIAALPAELRAAIKGAPISGEVA